MKYFNKKHCVVLAAVLFILSSTNLSTAVSKNNIIEKELAGLETVEESGILTYDQAVELAIEESINIENNLLKAESQDVLFDDRRDQFGYDLFNPEVLASMKLEENQRLNDKLTEKTDEYIKEGLAFTIRSIFYNIDTISQDIELQQDKIANEELKKSIIEVKLKYGMESQTNLTLKQVEIEQLVTDMDKLSKDLQEQYLSLNRLVGFDEFQTYHIEALPVKYEPVKDTLEDVEAKTNRTIDKDITIWGKEQQMDIQRIGVDFYALNFISGLPSDQQADPTPLQAQKIDVKVTANEIQQAKEDVRNAVADKYNNLKRLEASRDSAAVRLNELLERKRTLEAALLVGTVIEQDYRDILLAIKELSSGIEKIESQHQLLKEMYNNPLMAAGNVM